MPVRVDADDPVMSDLLSGTLDLVAEAGGWVHPSAVLVARAGQMSFACDAPTGSALIAIPREAMVRVDLVTWRDDDGMLAIAEVPDDVGDIEVQMLYLQAALHNQCGRLPWLAATHPVLARDVPPELVEAVRRLVPAFRTVSLRARDVLWANRCFRLPVGSSRSRVLVPIVDLLNHHAGGASGSWDGRAFTVTAERPFGTDECALDYGMGRDALETAVVYGFVDSSGDLAHSAPLRIEATDVGGLIVTASGRAADGSWLPMNVTITDRVTTISHLTFSRTDPRRPVRDLAHATGWGEARTARCVAIVAAENVRLLDSVVAAASGAPAAQTLARAAARQRDVIAPIAG